MSNYPEPYSTIYATLETRASGLFTGLDLMISDSLTVLAPSLLTDQLGGVVG